MGMLRNSWQWRAHGCSEESRRARPGTCLGSISTRQDCARYQMRLGSKESKGKGETGRSGEGRRGWRLVAACDDARARRDERCKLRRLTGGGGRGKGAGEGPATRHEAAEGVDSARHGHSNPTPARA